MATLNNTSINDTGFLTLPVNSNPAAGSQGSLRYNPQFARLEYYHTRDVSRWENLTNPFLTRCILRMQKRDIFCNILRSASEPVFTCFTFL